MAYINPAVGAVLFHQYTMTLLVRFLCSTQTRPIVEFNICASNFDYKILYGLADDYKQFIEQIWFDLEEGDAIISDKQFIEKIWYAAVEYDYIPEGFETLLMFVDSIKIS